MAVMRYHWGTQRPVARDRRKQWILSVAGPAYLAEIKQKFESDIAAYDAYMAEQERELKLIQISTRSGRYSRADASIAVAELGLEEDGRRPRGRPRKHPKGHRPSRAKTAAGQVRAVARKSIKTSVSPVTASSSRQRIAPGYAPNIEKALLGSAAAIAVAMDVADVALPPASDLPKEVADELTVAPANDIVRDLATKYKRVDTAELVNPEIAFSEESAEYVARNHKGIRRPVYGDEYERMDYDFSDPHDRTKVAPELLRAFPGFGISWVYPIDPRSIDPSAYNKPPLMSEANFREWVGPALFTDSDDIERETAEFLERTHKPFSLWWKYPGDFEAAIRLERDRVLIWPKLKERIDYVERYYNTFKRGEITLDHALVLTAKLDFHLIGLMTHNWQIAFYRAVNAMKWFEGFSIADLRAWAGSDAAIHRGCRSYSLFPAWLYPERLHAEIRDGYFDYPSSDRVCKIPDDDEFNKFVISYNEQSIANLRLPAFTGS